MIQYLGEVSLSVPMGYVQDSPGVTTQDLVALPNVAALECPILKTYGLC